MLPTMTEEFDVPHFRIPLEIFSGLLRVVVQTDDLDLIQARRGPSAVRLYGEPEAALESASGWCSGRGADAAVWIREMRHDVVVHEVYHATDRLLSAAGVRHCAETLEVYAGTFTYLLREVTSVLEQYTHEKCGQVPYVEAHCSTGHEQEQDRPGFLGVHADCSAPSAVEFRQSNIRIIGTDLR